MSGGTYEHSLINANFAREAGVRLKGSPCRVLEASIRVRMMHGSRYVYADTTVVSDPPQFDPLDLRRTTIINPHVTVEVLSDSTEAYDRGEKFTRYREIASLEEYVLVSQDHPLVETFMRQPEGTWLFDAHRGLDGIVKLRTLKIDIPLKDVYAEIEFPSLGPPR